MCAHLFHGSVHACTAHHPKQLYWTLRLHIDKVWEIVVGQLHVIFFWFQVCVKRLDHRCSRIPHTGNSLMLMTFESRCSSAGCTDNDSCPVNCHSSTVIRTTTSVGGDRINKIINIVGSASSTLNCVCICSVPYLETYCDITSAQGGNKICFWATMTSHRKQPGSNARSLYRRPIQRAADEINSNG